jgi:hypothetical protein
MASMYLLNTINMNTVDGVTTVSAGKLLTSAALQTAVINAGGQLWPANDDRVAAAAASVMHLRASRAIDEDEASRIMMLACEQSLHADDDSAKWRDYTVWWIDPLNGDDSNQGGSYSSLVPAAPLKTFREVVRRWGQPPVFLTATHNDGSLLDYNPIVFYVLNDMSRADSIMFDVIASLAASVVLIVGARKPLKTGLVTTFTALNGTTNTKPSMTCSTVADFTPYINCRIRITSGARKNSTAYILTGGATPTISPPSKPSGYFVAADGDDPFSSIDTGCAPLNFVVGDTFVIEDLAKVYVNGPTRLSTPQAVTLTTFPGVTFQDCRFDMESGDTLTFESNLSSFFMFVGCIFDGTVKFRNLENTFINVCNSRNALQFINCPGGVSVQGGVVDSQSIGDFGFPLPSKSSGSFIALTSDVLFWHGGLVGDGIRIVGAAFFDTQPTSPNPLAAGIVVGASPVFVLSGGHLSIFAATSTQGLCGNGNGLGIAVGPGGQIVYEPTAHMTLTGTAGNFQIGAAGSISPINPTTGAVYGPVAQTYANLAAARPGGFGQEFWNPNNMASISKRVVI